MNKLFTVLSSIAVLLFLGCNDAYSSYMNSRTLEQQMADEQNQKTSEQMYNSRKIDQHTEQTIDEFNKKAEKTQK